MARFRGGVAHYLTRRYTIYGGVISIANLYLIVTMLLIVCVVVFI